MLSRRSLLNALLNGVAALGIGLAIGPFAATEADAQPRPDHRPQRPGQRPPRPPPRPERRPPPRRGFRWRSGRWVFHPHLRRWVWVPGRWWR
jgi:hypothetical protein